MNFSTADNAWKISERKKGDEKQGSYQDEKNGDEKQRAYQKEKRMILLLLLLLLF